MTPLPAFDTASAPRRRMIGTFGEDLDFTLADVASTVTARALGRCCLPAAAQSKRRRTRPSSESIRRPTRYTPRDRSKVGAAGRRRALPAGDGDLSRMLIDSSDANPPALRLLRRICACGTDGVSHSQLVDDGWSTAVASRLLNALRSRGYAQLDPATGHWVATQAGARRAGDVATEEPRLSRQR
jgi:hypothetical protein